MKIKRFIKIELEIEVLGRDDYGEETWKDLCKEKIQSLALEKYNELKWSYV